MRVAAVLLLFFPAAVIADAVILTDGTVVEGRYLGDEGGFARIESPSGEQRIPSNNVARVELAYPGIPVCYRRKGSHERTCQGKLFLLYGSQAEIVEGPGHTEKRRLDISEFEELEFERKGEGEKVIPRIKEGARVRLALEAGSVEGNVERLDQGRISIRDDSGELVHLREEEIRRLELPTPAPQAEAAVPGFWSRLVPGLPQYRREEKSKAFLFWSLLGAFAAGAALEEYTAGREIARARSNFFYMYLGVSSREPAFAAHRRNAAVLAGGLVLTYGFHIADEFVLSRGPRGSAQAGLTIFF